MEIPNRAPTMSWHLRRDFKGGYVRTDDDEQIVIVMPSIHYYGAWDGIRTSRTDARLLAKRINQCLDATVKK